MGSFTASVESFSCWCTNNQIILRTDNKSKHEHTKIYCLNRNANCKWKWIHYYFIYVTVLHSVSWVWIVTFFFLYKKKNYFFLTVKNKRKTYIVFLLFFVHFHHHHIPISAKWTPRIFLYEFLIFLFHFGKKQKKNTPGNNDDVVCYCLHVHVIRDKWKNETLQKFRKKKRNKCIKEAYGNVWDIKLMNRKHSIMHLYWF